MNNIPPAGYMMGALAMVCIGIVFIFLHKALMKSGWAAARRRSVMITLVMLAVIWVIIIGVLSGNGFFSDFTQLPPRPVLTILIPLPFILWMAFSRKTKTLLLSMPPHWLIFFQSFRVIVELILWFAFTRGILPGQMTFEGRNWDIMAGLLAIPAGWMVMKRKNGYLTVAIWYNIIGLLLLLNVLTIALLSMPGPLRYFMNEPSVERVGTFPFIYLPAVLVVLAYSFHILSLRQLWLVDRKFKRENAT